MSIPSNTPGRSRSTTPYRPLFLDRQGDLRPSVERELSSISTAFAGVQATLDSAAIEIDTRDLHLQSITDPQTNAITKPAIIRWQGLVKNASTNKFERSEINLGIYPNNPSQLIWNYTTNVTGINFNRMNIWNANEVSIQSSKNDDVTYHRSGYNTLLSSQGGSGVSGGGQATTWYERHIAQADKLSSFIIQLITNGVNATAGAGNTTPIYWHFQQNGVTGGPLGELTHGGSDVKLKHNVHDADKGSLYRICQIQPRQFTWNHTGRNARGFIAQELEKVDPIYTYDSNDIKNVDDRAIIADLIGAIQELKLEIEQLKGVK